MNQETNQDRLDQQQPGDPAQGEAPIQERRTKPGQDPLVNPGYQPLPQDLPAEDHAKPQQSDVRDGPG